jgi:hypothetical protein
MKARATGLSSPALLEMRIAPRAFVATAIAGDLPGMGAGFADYSRVAVTGTRVRGKWTARHCGDAQFLLF